MEDDWVILRDLSVPNTREPFGPSIRASDINARAETIPQPKIEFETADVNRIRDLARDPEVAGIARAMPTALIEPVETADEAGRTSWGVQAVGADQSQFTGDGVTVAVLDTGIDAGHAAFSGMNLVEQDFTVSGNGDVQGHGTHCAGTIFGRDVDGNRIGIARGVQRALIGKVLGNDGRGDSLCAFGVCAGLSTAARM